MKRRITSIALALIMAIVAIGSTVGIASASSCNGHEVIPHTDPSPGVWWTPKKVGLKRLIVHFWTNWPGRNQLQFKVKIPATANVQLAGGGSNWWFSCKSGWLASYTNDPLPGHTLRWMKNHGLARNR